MNRFPAFGLNIAGLRANTSRLRSSLEGQKRT
jgi:hypothetical protein